MLKTKFLKIGRACIGHIPITVTVSVLFFSISPQALSDQEPRLRLAPIQMARHVDGQMGYFFQRTSADNSKATQQSLQININAGIALRSFIWQPWLVQIGGELSGGIGRNNTFSSTSPAQKAVTTAVNREANLTLLAKSRFPFDARLFTTENNYASANKQGHTIRNTGYTLKQDYASRNQRIKGMAIFTHTKNGAAGIPSSFSDSLSSNLSLALSKSQSVAIGGSSNTQKQPGDGLRNSYKNLSATHSYMPSSSFVVASTADILKMNQELAQANSPMLTDAFNSRQFSSLASWRPEESPLTMTSGVLLRSSDRNLNGLHPPKLTSTNFNLGANYLFSPLIRIYGSVNAYDSLGTQTVTSNGAVVANKRYGTTVNTEADLAGFRYSGSVGGSLSTNNTTVTKSISQTSTQNSLTLGLGVNLSHALNKISQLGSGHLVTNVQQGISSGVSTGGTRISNLSTSGGWLWNKNEGVQSTRLQLRASDSYSLTNSTHEMQMINFQASRKEATARNQSLQGSLTVQATHSKNANTLTPSASVNYAHVRAFNVPNLKFQSDLLVSDLNILPESINSSSRSWDNKLSYSLAKLDLNLNTRLSLIGNSTSIYTYFSVIRSF